MPQLVEFPLAGARTVDVEVDADAGRQSDGVDAPDEIQIDFDVRLSGAVMAMTSKGG